MKTSPLYQVRGPNATIRLYDDYEIAEQEALRLDFEMPLSEQDSKHSVITIRTEEGKAV